MLAWQRLDMYRVSRSNSSPNRRWPLERRRTLLHTISLSNSIILSNKKKGAFFIQLSDKILFWLLAVHCLPSIYTLNHLLHLHLVPHFAPIHHIHFKIQISKSKYQNIKIKASKNQSSVTTKTEPAQKMAKKLVDHFAWFVDLTYKRL